MLSHGRSQLDQEPLLGPLLIGIPEGPSTQYSRTLVPKTTKGVVFGSRVLIRWVLGPSALGILPPALLAPPPNRDQSRFT